MVSKDAPRTRHPNLQHQPTVPAIRAQGQASRPPATTTQASPLGRQDETEGRGIETPGPANAQPVAQPDAQHRCPYRQIPPSDDLPNIQLNTQPDAKPDILPDAGPEAKPDADPDDQPTAQSTAEDLTVPLLLPTHLLPPKLPSQNMRSKPNGYLCLHRPPTGQDPD